MNLFEREYRTELEQNVLLRKLLLVLLSLLIVSIFILFGMGYELKQQQSQNNKLKSEINTLNSDIIVLEANSSRLKGVILHQSVKLSANIKTLRQSFIDELSKVYYIEDIPLTMTEQAYIYKIADKYDIPHHIFLGLIELESNFNKLAINHNTNGTIDYGVSQISSANKDWLEKELGRELDLMNFYDNIECAGFIFNSFRQDTLEHTVLAYNRGVWGANTYYRKYGTYEHAYTRLIFSKAEKYKGDD